MITLTIDGKTMEVAPGSTILEASLAHGIDIPRLCYHPELAPLGAAACVWSKSRDSPSRSPVVACGVPDMVVHTQSDVLTRLRRDTIDLFVSDHPLRCVVCDKNGACDLQRYAYQYGVAETSYEFELSRSCSSRTTRSLCAITSTASCAPNACGCATKWSAPMPLTSWGVASPATWRHRSTGR